MSFSIDQLNLDSILSFWYNLNNPKDSLKLDVEFNGTIYGQCLVCKDHKRETITKLLHLKDHCQLYHDNRKKQKETSKSQKPKYTEESVAHLKKCWVEKTEESFPGLYAKVGDIDVIDQDGHIGYVCKVCSSQPLQYKGPSSLKMHINTHCHKTFLAILNGQEPEPEKKKVKVDEESESELDKVDKFYSELDEEEKAKLLKLIEEKK